MDISFYDSVYVDNVKQAIIGKDFNYIIELIEEIINRLSLLTPNSFEKRRENLLLQIDLDLTKQMLENNAFGANEFYHIINTFFDQINELQAPIDKYQLDIIKNKLNNIDSSQTWADIVSPFFLYINKLIDLIYKRREDALNDPVIVAMLLAGHNK